VNPVLGLIFIKDPHPPICKDHNIEQTIDLWGIKALPTAINLTRDSAVPEHPPRRLNRAPPLEYRICEHSEGLVPPSKVREVGRAGS